MILVGGGPQGTLLGQIEYLVKSNDNADMVPPEDRFKYIDDLSVLHLVCMSDILTEYDFRQHVPSDIATDSLYLPPDSYESQSTLNSISNWTRENLMTINEKKCNYSECSISDPPSLRDAGPTKYIIFCFKFFKSWLLNTSISSIYNLKKTYNQEDVTRKSPKRLPSANICCGWG